MAAPWRRRFVGAAVAISLSALARCGAAERVVSLADLHGDFRHAVVILQAAGLIEEGNDKDLQGPDGLPFQHYRGVRWLGGNATLVQTGDMVDRGTFARDLYALFAELRRQAAADGGRVVNLMGNHDLMNLEGDLRYVSGEDEADFGGRAARREAFAPAGWLGQQLLEFPAAAVAGETLFVHAGLLPEHVENGLDSLNEELRRQLQASSMWGSKGLLKAHGPLWLRRQAMASEADICPGLLRTLQLTGARRMVVGHTQVDDGVVRTRCGGRLLMADTIISREGYPMCWQPTSMKVEGCQGSLSYVEIRDGNAFVVRVPPPDGPEGATLEERPLPIKDVERGEL